MTPSDDDDRRRRIETTFGAHYGAVAAYFHRRCETRQDADDATAQVFAVAWKRLDRLPPEPDTRLWLYGVARRVLAEQRRATRRRGRLDAKLVAGATSTDAAIDPIAGVDEALEVRAAWRGLSDGDRELLALVAWEGLAVAEVATVLGVPAPLVSARLSKARRRLAARLADVPAPSPVRARAPSTAHAPTPHATTPKEPRHA